LHFILHGLFELLAEAIIHPSISQALTKTLWKHHQFLTGGQEEKKHSLCDNLYK
jgi:hypothetical protein